MDYEESLSKCELHGRPGQFILWPGNIQFYVKIKLGQIFITNCLLRK